MYSVAELRPGQAIEIEGTPFLVLTAQFSRKSQGKGNCVTKIKNLKTGAIIQRTFIGSEKLAPADVGFRHVQFLYKNGDVFTFMDLETFDQFDLGKDVVGEGGNYLTDGLELDALLFDEKPIGLKLPVTVQLKVTETMPGVKGDTATGGTKPATLETGYQVHVPLFVNEGDTIKVNTERGEYVERV
jgi:elongation factor P